MDWKEFTKQMDKLEKEENILSWSCDEWKKGNHDRGYIKAVNPAGSTMECGYFDFKDEIYVPINKYKKQFNVFTLEKE